MSATAITLHRAPSSYIRNHTSEAAEHCGLDCQGSTEGKQFSVSQPYSEIAAHLDKPVRMNRFSVARVGIVRLVDLGLELRAGSVCRPRIIGQEQTFPVHPE
jgi:hypothetical protein